MARVLNKYRDDVHREAVNIMRPTKWGNPFSIGAHGSRDEVILKYKNWITSKPDLILAARRELAGKDLVCCCAPQKCHGDILLEIANGSSSRLAM